MQLTDWSNCNDAEHTQRSLKVLRIYEWFSLLKKTKGDLQDSLSVQVNLNQKSKEWCILFMFFKVILELKCKKETKKGLSN